VVTACTRGRRPVTLPPELIVDAIEAVADLILGDDDPAHAADVDRLTVGLLDVLAALSGNSGPASGHA
jgi:hypothetical protein